MCQNSSQCCLYCGWKKIKNKNESRKSLCPQRDSLSSLVEKKGVRDLKPQINIEL